MRAQPFVSRWESVLRGLWSTSWRAWWTSFVLATLLIVLWSLANPPFAGPDEPAHVIRADALDHGELTGEKPSGRIDGELRRVESSVRVVQAPEIYRPSSGPPCFALQQRAAWCQNVTGSSRDTAVPTYEALQPPAYYTVIGVASWLPRAGSGTAYLMRLLSLLITGALVATAITALRRAAAPRLLASGLLLAITPTVLFIGGVVNPSGPEIAASLTFWVCGLVLVAHARERVDTWLVTAVGIAGCVLALSRQLGPLWLGLIALVIVGCSDREALQSLARSSRARLWGALVAASALGQIAWDAVVGASDPTLVNRDPGLAIIEPLALTGSLFRQYREMIGWFGWLDTPAPVLTWLPWTAALAFLFFVALAWVGRRHLALLLALLAAVIVVPAVIESTPYESAETYWQGRYILPLAVGIPIVAAFALASTERGRELATRRFVLTIGVVVGVAQFLAFAQNLRRYTVGYDGPILYWLDAEWSPPLPAALLTLAYAVVAAAFVSFVLTGPGARVRPREDERERMQV